MTGPRAFLAAGVLFFVLAIAAIARSELTESPTDTSLSRGVYVYCGWADPRPEWAKVPGMQSPWPKPWKIFRTRDREPALGYYDERDPAVTTWRLEKMREGKIDFAVYQIGWSYIHSIPEKMPSWEVAKGEVHPLLYSHCADNHRDHAPKFALSFFDVMADSGRGDWGDSYWHDRIRDGWTRETFAESVTRFGQTLAVYMAKPSYYRIAGKPVLFWGYPQGLTYWAKLFDYAPKPLSFGYSPREVIELVRAAIGDVYVVATAVDPAALPNLKAWGFDAFTEYLFYADSWDAAVRTYRAKWREGVQIAREQNIHYWIPATAGFDGTALGLPLAEDPRVPFMPTPTEFAEHLREAQRFALENFDITRGQVVVYAWNEFGEGGVIEPMKFGMLHDADEMLRAFRAAAE